MLGAFLYFVFGSALAPVATESHAAQNGASIEEAQQQRQALEEELRRLEEEMARQENTIKTLRTQGKTLQSEIAKLNAESRKLALQIQAVEFSLAKLNREITENTEQIGVTEGKLELNKSALTKTMQELYEQNSANLLEILLRSENLSSFFGDVSSLLEVQGSLSVTINRVNDLKTELLDEQDALLLKKNDAQTLKLYRDTERRNVEQVKSEKGHLLTATKGKESKYQELLKETRKTAAQIRSRIFELLGGGELTFEEAYDFAKFAEQATGVRAAFLLAVLDRESALGQNVGKCKYNEMNPRTGRLTMHPTRDVPAFLALTSFLGIDPVAVTVSCANSDGTYGGAMGPAQFIPSTWNIYKDRVAEITGGNPSSPWRNADAFVAAALYLKDAGADRNERTAAAKYYCGASWNRYVCTGVYGRKVVERAEQFQQDINILSS